MKREKTDSVTGQQYRLTINEFQVESEATRFPIQEKKTVF